MFDFIAASSHRATIPGTVVTKDSTTISLWLQPHFAPDDAGVFNLFDVAGVRYRLYHSGANTWTMYADGRTKTFTVTSLWIAGQLIHVKAEWTKTGDVMTLSLNGTAVTPSVGSGTWSTTAVGATAYIGCDTSAANCFDGGIGHLAIWNRSVTVTELSDLAKGIPAKECALSGLQWSAPFDINEKADWNPGGEEATVIGSPSISQHPLILRRGARVLVEGFQSALGATGLMENQGWTLTGTPTASTKIESVAAPAGTPLALGTQVLRVDHLATENAIYDIKSIGAQTRGYFSAYVQGVTGSGTCRLLGILGAGNQNCLRVWVAPTLITVTRHPTGSTPTWTKTIAAERWYRVELAWDTVAGTTQAWVDGVSIGSASEVLEYTPAKVLIGHDSTSTTVAARLAALDVRSDRRPDALYDGAFDLDGTNDYLTAPQALATTIQDEGAVCMFVRPDFLPAETTLRNLFRADQGASNRLRFVKSATTNIVQFYNNARVLACTATALWVSGQWLVFICQWKKSTDTMEVYLNGTTMGGSKTGTWGAEAISSVLGFGGHSAGNMLDGALGRIHVLSQLLTAGEIAELSEGKHPRQVCPAKWIESWRPGSLVGEKGAYNLTNVGAPAIDEGPGIQDAVGAVEVRSHFVGTGYEQPWTAAGTPTADTLIDPDVAYPAGWPPWAGRPCRFKQLATENALSISKVLSATDLDTYWHREVIYPITLPAGNCYVVSLLNGSAASTVTLAITATKIKLYYHVDAGDVAVDIADVSVGKIYYVEIGYSVSGQWVAYRVNGHLGNKPYTYITGVTLDRGGLRSLYLRTSTVTTYSVEFLRGAIEGRTDRAQPSPASMFKTPRQRLLLGVESSVGYRAMLP